MDWFTPTLLRVLLTKCLTINHNPRYMAKCLVTKLNGVVDNENLLKEGEFKVELSQDSSTHSFDISFNKDSTLRIIGDGNFTENSSKVFTIPANTNKTVKISNTDCTVIIPNKKNIAGLSCINIEGLSFDVRELSLSKNLQVLHLTPKCYGDISALKELTEIKTFVSGGVKGDITNISGWSKLAYLQCSNLSGDLGKAAEGLDSISDINMNGSIQLHGDLSKLKDSCINVGNDFSGSFSWETERSSEYPIISFVGGTPFGNYIDAMLINQAKCKVSSNNNKLIVVRGTRTSASDEAVATLQSKGYSVYIQ